MPKAKSILVDYATEKSLLAEEATAGMRYVTGIPRKLPQGRVLMHNDVQHTIAMPHAMNGFRAWTAPASPANFEPCKCGWSGLPHWHAKGTRHTCVEKLHNEGAWGRL